MTVLYTLNRKTPQHRITAPVLSLALVFFSLGCAQQPATPQTAPQPAPASVNTDTESSPTATPSSLDVVVVGEVDDTGDGDGDKNSDARPPPLQIKPLVVSENPGRTKRGKTNPGKTNLGKTNLGSGEALTESSGQQDARPTVKLRPRLRSLPHNQAIQLVATEAIKLFTDEPRVLDQQKIDSAPYIIGSLDNHVASATGNTVYARGILNESELYSIFRHGRTLSNPDNGKVLGQEMVFIADAKVLSYGDPSTLLITKSKRETLSGDVLLPYNRDKSNYHYTPKVLEQPVQGTIISLFNALTRAARNQVVIINRGQRDGLERGHLLKLEKRGERVHDVVSKSIKNTLTLPDIRLGIVMIFKVFDQVSYGVIMESTHTVQVGDIVTNL